MAQGKRKRVVRLADGSSLSLGDLPPPDTRRWVASRKALVVQAVRSGLLTHEQACARWSLSEEELQGWIDRMQRHGVGALKATAARRYGQP